MARHLDSFNEQVNTINSLLFLHFCGSGANINLTKYMVKDILMLLVEHEDYHRCCL